MAGRAEVAYVDVFIGEAGGKKLRSIGFAQIETDVFGRRLVSRRHHVQPLQRIRLVARAEFIKPPFGVAELRRELADQFRSNFVAAPAYGRSDRRQNVGWLAD